MAELSEQVKEVVDKEAEDREGGLAKDDIQAYAQVGAAVVGAAICTGLGPIGMAACGWAAGEIGGAIAGAIYNIIDGVFGDFGVGKIERQKAKENPYRSVITFVNSDLALVTNQQTLLNAVQAVENFSSLSIAAIYEIGVTTKLIEPQPIPPGDYFRRVCTDEKAGQVDCVNLSRNAWNWAAAQLKKRGPKLQIEVRDGVFFSVPEFAVFGLPQERVRGEAAIAKAYFAELHRAVELTIAELTTEATIQAVQDDPISGVQGPQAAAAAAVSAARGKAMADAEAAKTKSSAMAPLLLGGAALGAALLIFRR